MDDHRYCPECGHENPAAARFCMDCGHSLTGEAAPAAAPRDQGTDWGEIAAAALAFLSLRRLSRQARQTVVVVAFLLLFFGCPMVCGFAVYLLDWLARLFQ